MSSGWPLEWWPCPACGGAGVRILYAAPIINPKRKRTTPEADR
jgi:hypothetical protein